ncbi:uncharacterized protein LOC128870482 [Anastrepha ludens]|uniref:uncharacterized protein LOC128869665 n=1 Tax=Anastrepha ludens TaxID=28586 RepID=UPI0023B10A35|nr:uncharacterized protein LOC128869665 [Anastrepha ludens]XP_053969138.1 uncharacterized protein LOC128870482 [Anastrepha ludens]
MDQFFHFGKRLTNLENIFNENKIEASEQLTQFKTVRECKVLLRRIHHSVCKMTGEEVDEIQTEISSTLPLQTLAAAEEFEKKLLQQQYLEAMKTLLLKIKGPETTVDDLLRQLYSNEMLSLCNWDGRATMKHCPNILLFRTYFLIFFSYADEQLTRRTFVGQLSLVTTVLSSEIIGSGI